MPKVHFESIRRAEFMGESVTRKFTLCNRVGAKCDDVDSTPLRHEVTCKFCLKLLMAVKREAA